MICTARRDSLTLAVILKNMWDFLKRAVRHPFDYAGILRCRRLTFVQKNDEGGGIYSFTFKTKRPIHWKAGQHGVFVVSKMQPGGRTWRPFSIVSTPAEGVIKIATGISDAPSNFKRALTELTPEENITMYGPFGEFHLRSGQKQIVAIAGGIGITPVRSICKEITSGLHPNTKLDLVYAGKNGYFAFKSEFDEFINHPNISISYVNTPDEVNAAIEHKAHEYGNSASYFISGSPGMITALRQKFTTLGITDITNDPFKAF